MQMKRKGHAVWKGAGKNGKGHLTTDSGILKDTAYSFSTRFEHGTGTNPEELLGAAHAGCFSMQLAFMIGELGFTPDELKTDAEVVIAQGDQGFSITEINLTLNAKVPGLSQEQFKEVAEKAKAGCPVSKLFKGNAKISLKAELH